MRYVAQSVQTTNPWNLILPYDVSGDGRYIAFITYEQLTPEDTNTALDVYLWDALALTYERISVPSGGGSSNSTSNRPSISADGRYVAFQSLATNLVAGDTNGQFDIFVRDRVAGTTTRVSVSSTGAQATGSSTAPKISADGTVVAFQSTAFDLVANDNNGAADAFVRDLTASTTTRVSVRTAGGEADAGSGGPVLSGDGHFVAFTSSATNLVSDDTNGAVDVFVHDRTTGITERVSVSSTGVQANNASSAPAISHDGRFVAFATSATNLVPNGGSSGAIVVRDREAHNSLNVIPGQLAKGLAISADGRYIVGYAEDGTAFVRDRVAARSHYFSSSTGVDIAHPLISRNGRYVVLLSNDALVATAPSGTKMFIAGNPL
jgi:Tol biopolymer transport system component